MNLKMVETSLNLRIEKGKTRDDYTLSKTIAKEQLSYFGTDIYANVEYMECRDEDYMKCFADAGYTAYTSVDHNKRGILCHIKSCYEVEKCGESADPHMLHLRIKSNNTASYVDLIVVRILVSTCCRSSDEKTIADFKDRNKQWQRIVNYIKTLGDKTHIVLTGDFNHGVIAENIACYKSKPREFYNYQMICRDLQDLNISVIPIDGFSKNDFLKIDHVAVATAIEGVGRYEDPFGKFGGQENRPIGIPDHSILVTEFELS